MKQTLLSALLLSLTISQASHADMNSAITAFEQGEMDKATELFEAESSSLQAKIYLARILMRSDLDDAEDWIEDAVEQDADSAEVHYWRGRVMGQQASESFLSALSYAKKSKASFARAVELEPDSIKYQTGLFRFHVNAPGIAGGDIDIAKKVADDVTKLDKKAGIKLHIDLAQKQEDEELVMQLLEQGKTDFSGLPDFYFKAGIINQQNKDYSAAMKEFAKASELSGDDDESLQSQWGALYQIGRTAVFSKSELEQGISALQRYVEQAPQVEALPSKLWAQFRMANLMEMADQKEQAKGIYKQLTKSDDKELVKQVKKHI